VPTEQAPQRYGAALNRVLELIVVSISGLVLEDCRERSGDPEWPLVRVSDALRKLVWVGQRLTGSPHYQGVGDSSERV